MGIGLILHGASKGSELVYILDQNTKDLYKVLIQMDLDLVNNFI